MEPEVRKIYDRFYDDQTKQKNAKLLGEFQVIEQIMEDGYDELFIGRNIESGDICLIKGYEVCYYNSGMGYAVYPLKNLLSPCDLCIYNPPSSMDGKPCSICPACAIPR